MFSDVAGGVLSSSPPMNVASRNFCVWYESSCLYMVRNSLVIGLLGSFFVMEPFLSGRMVSLPCTPTLMSNHPLLNWCQVFASATNKAVLVG